MFKRIKTAYENSCRKIGLMNTTPTRAQTQAMLFALGIALISAGLATNAEALVTNYNDARIANSVNFILTYIEGTFGALVMVAAGIGAILSSAFGQYRAALGLLVVAVGSFILRSVLATFFNDTQVMA